jgi:hypothetical protein
MILEAVPRHTQRAVAHQMSVLRLPRKRVGRQDLWPEAKDDAIRTWKAAGWSSRQMATKLHVTRNAVIGRMNRLKKRNDWHMHVPAPAVPRPVQAFPAPEPMPDTPKPKIRAQRTPDKPHGVCRFGTCTATRLRPYEFCAAHMPGRAA